jgi:DNA-binding NarL/FixJ family response regulator
MNPRAVSVVVVSGHALRRGGVERALSNYPGVDVAGVATDLDAASELVRETRAEGVIVDLDSVDENGDDRLRALRQHQDVSIVCFTSDERRPTRAIRDVAHVLRPREGIGQAVLALVDPQQVEEAKARRTPRSDGSPLTRRERQILGALARGGTAAEIAEEFGISVSTVGVHKRNLYAKLGVRSQTEAVAVALNRHLIEWSADRTSA